MADFRTSLLITKNHEGGYANVAGDTGGETILGIAKNSWGTKYPGIFKRLDEIKKEAKGNIKKINEIAFSDETFLQEVEKFYRDNFWNTIKGDEIVKQEDANALFDYAVNSGVARAVKHAQEVLGVAVDGKFGNASLQALNSCDGFCNKLCERRIQFLHAIAQKGQNAKFLKGWLNRVNSFIKK